MISGFSPNPSWVSSITLVNESSSFFFSRMLFLIVSYLTLVSLSAFTNWMKNVLSNGSETGSGYSFFFFSKNTNKIIIAIIIIARMIHQIIGIYGAVLTSAIAKSENPSVVKTI